MGIGYRLPCVWVCGLGWIVSLQAGDTGISGGGGCGGSGCHGHARGRQHLAGEEWQARRALEVEEAEDSVGMAVALAAITQRCGWGLEVQLVALQSQAEAQVAEQAAERQEWGHRVEAWDRHITELEEGAARQAVVASEAAAWQLGDAEARLATTVAEARRLRMQAEGLGQAAREGEEQAAENQRLQATLVAQEAVVAELEARLRCCASEEARLAPCFPCHAMGNANTDLM